MLDQAAFDDLETHKQYNYAYEDANDVCVSEALYLQVPFPFPHPPLSDTVTETVTGTSVDAQVPEQFKKLKIVPERVVVTVYKLSGDAVQLDLAPLARDCLHADGAQITSYFTSGHPKAKPTGDLSLPAGTGFVVRRTKKDFSSRLRTALARAVLGTDAGVAEVAGAAPRVMLVADGEEVPEVDRRAAGDGS